MNASGSGPISVRKCFVSSTAALPGWQGEGCWWLGTAAETGFLLGRSEAGVALESGAETNKLNGLGLDGCWTSLQPLHLSSGLLLAAALWFCWVPSSRPDFRHDSITLGFWLLVQLTTNWSLCADANCWFPPPWMLNQIPLQRLSDGVHSCWECSWALQARMIQADTHAYNYMLNAESILPYQLYPQGEKGVLLQEERLFSLILRMRSSKTKPVCASF